MSPFSRRLQRVPQSVQPAGGGKILAVYFPGYYRGSGVGTATIANLNWNSFSHIIDFSMGLHDGHLSTDWIADGGSSLVGNSWSSGQASLLCTEANSRGKNAILCLGSANCSQSWNANLDTPQKRETIAAEIADNLATHGYKGVDLDGEPGYLITNYRLFWQTILAEFAARGWRTPGPNYRTVTMACFGSETALAKNAVLDGLDWVAPMLYSPYGAASQHISPLSGTGDPWDLWVGAWTTGANAIPPQKILPGLSYYAFSWSGTTGPNQAYSGINAEQHWSVVNAAIGGVEAPNATWYTPAMAHGMVISGSWYSFESAASVQAKADWVVANDMGGAIVWMYQHGSLGGANHPLAGAVQAAFGPLIN
jgi:hypothetical protein